MRPRGQSQRLRLARAFQGRRDERPARHDARILRLRRLRVLVHHPREQLLVEAAPVHADAHRLVVAAGELDQRGELVVALRAAPDVAGIYPQLRERLARTRDAA